MTKKETAEGETAPRSRKKLIVIGLAVVLTAAVAFAGYKMFLGPSGTEEEAKPEAGVVLVLEPITVNLADGHFLKVGLALQATADASEEMDGSRALDVTINHLSNMKVAQLSSPTGRNQAKKDLVKHVGEAYEGHVMDIYFTEFVMQ